MPSFSDYGYYVDQPTDTRLRVAGNPTDVSTALDVADSLVHLADVSGQCWSNFGLESGQAIPTDASPFLTGSGFLYRLWSDGPFPARTVPSISSTYRGEPFGVRFRFGAASTGAVGTSTFYMVLQPGIDSSASRAAALAVQGGATRSNVITFSTSSSTPAWLSPTPATNLLHITTDELPTWSIDSRLAFAGLDGSNHSESVGIVALTVDIYCTTSANGITPTLNGLYLCEYCT